MNTQMNSLRNPGVSHSRDTKLLVLLRSAHRHALRSGPLEVDGGSPADTNRPREESPGSIGLGSR